MDNKSKNLLMTENFGGKALNKEAIARRGTKYAGEKVKVVGLMIDAGVGGGGVRYLIRPLESAGRYVWIKPDEIQIL